MGGKGSGRRPYKRFMPSADADTERPWPIRNPAYADVELQDEAVRELQSFHSAILAELVVDGKPNPLLDEMEHMEAVCIANGVLRPSRQGKKSLLRFMAEGMIENS